MDGALVQAGDKVYTPWLRQLDKWPNLEALISHSPVKAKKDTEKSTDEIDITITLQKSSQQKAQEEAVMANAGMRGYISSDNKRTLTRNLHRDDLKPFIEELETRKTEAAKKIADYLRALQYE